MPKAIVALKLELTKLGNPTKAAFVSRYFKTGKGEYGEGDIFLGLKVPDTRNVAKKYTTLSLNEIENLLTDPIHEFRMAALMILTERFRKGADEEQKEIYDFYLSHTAYINNWDLIDGSAPGIVGGYLINKPQKRKLLYMLARSKSIWERRIAMLATYTFLRKGDFVDTFAIANILLHDTHDLIHKAVGWMLREVGKKDQKAEETFLQIHYKSMPRTMLRYSIEHFEEGKRRKYLHIGTI